MGRKQKRKRERRRSQKDSPPPKDPPKSREPSSFNKRFRQVSPTKFKVGGFAGRDLGCFIPALMAPVVMLLFLYVFGVPSRDVGDALLIISLGAQLFPLFAVVILLLARKFVFDKDTGELTAFNVLHKEHYPLTAVQSAEVGFRSHVVGNDGPSSNFHPQRTVGGIGVGIVLNTGEEDFCLDMSFNCNLGDSVEKAEQLATFLEVPISGAAYEKFKSCSV